MCTTYKSLESEDSFRYFQTAFRVAAKVNFMHKKHLIFPGFHRQVFRLIFWKHPGKLTAGYPIFFWFGKGDSLLLNMAIFSIYMLNFMGCNFRIHICLLGLSSHADDAEYLTCLLLPWWFGGDVQFSLPECFASNIHRIATISRWWFQRFFMFTPNFGEDEPSLTAIFQGGLVQAPTRSCSAWLAMLTNRISFFFQNNLLQAVAGPNHVRFFPLPQCKLPVFFGAIPYCTINGTGIFTKFTY